MNRREFFSTLGIATLSALLPQLALANSIGFNNDRRLLLLVELKGANDGLNTLIPYTESKYYDLRPNLAVQRSEVIRLSDKLGLHPKLKPLLETWDQDELAWVQGLGYENPNRSHFESIEIWDSADSNIRELQDGWVARSFPDHELGGIAIDTNLGPLYGNRFSALSISDPKRFANQGRNIKAAYVNNNSNSGLEHILRVQSEVDMLADTLASYLADVPPPKQAFAQNPFGRSLNSVYTLIASGLNVPAYKVSLGNFDTHVNQPIVHERLLDTLAMGLSTLRINLQALEMWDELVIMTYSEFGRRVQENGSKGTDHGTAAPHLIMGGQINGGWYGEHPSLNDLDSRGDLVYTTDFQDLYTTIKQNWWSLEGSKKVLGFV